MATPLAIAWQTSMTQVGEVYQLVYLAMGNATISADTLKAFKTRLDFQSDVTIVSEPKLLGRVVTINVKATKSAPFTTLLDGILYAGAPQIGFKLTNVFDLLVSSPSIAETVAHTAATIFDAGRDVGEKIADAVTPNFNIGGAIGSNISAVVKPLILPAVLLLTGLYLFGKIEAGGIR